MNKILINILFIAWGLCVNTAHAAVSSAPVITLQPSDATVIAPAKASFKVRVTAKPAPSYQWMQSVDGGAFSNITGATKTTYTTDATSLSDSGTQYECVVSNTAGTVTSNVATLTVNTKPSITTQPVSQTVTAPATATFTVAGTGSPAPTYQWEQESSGDTVFTAIAGATNVSYTTAATTLADSKTKFKCVVSNVAGGAASLAVTLTVDVSPSITTQPADATVVVPAKATFTVVASGTPAPKYQWMESINGAPFTNITHATKDSYTTPATKIAQNGTQYECVVSNIAGSQTSNPASLTVNSSNSSTTVTIASPVDQSTLTTGSLSITAVTQGDAASVSFYNGATLLGTVTSPSAAFTYPWVNIPAGTYTLTAVVTDNTGATNPSAPVTVIIHPALFTYAVDNNIASQTDALNHATAYQYDNLNRLLKTTFADGSTVSLAYDLFGNQTSVTDQRGNTLSKTYDAYERLIQTKDPLGGITQFNYDTNGRLLALTDANGHATNYTYDPDARVLTQSNALNFTISFTYDPVGNVLSRSDANGKTTSYSYDALNRLTGTTYPDGTSVANAYDALSCRILMIDATGQTTYAYDALSRLLTKTAPGMNNAITYTYDSEGNRLTSVDQNNRTITNTYDALNRLSSVTDLNGTTVYAYDADSNTSSVAPPNGVREAYTYDDLNRVLTTVNATSSGVISSFSNIYDVAGMITKKAFADGPWTAYSYDALNRLLEETKQTNTSTIYDYVYRYDPVGNRLSWINNTTLGGFWSVDSLNMPPQVLANMTNGGYGNTANPTQVVNLVRNYNYDAANRLISWNYGINIYATSFPAQTDTYTYDQNGNRVSKQAVLTGQETAPQQTSYGYDFENRLNQLTYTNIPNITGAQTDNFSYSGEGLRTGVVANSIAANYLYDGLNILVERDGSGNTTKSYTRGLDLGGGIGSIINQNYTANNAAVTQYYDYNDLGSTVDLTTPAGTTASSYSYDAFGNLLTPQASSDTNRYLFSTKEFDERSGLDYFGARYYDPEIGRWLTQDPTGFSDGVNLYLYAHDNPINLVDPNGSVSQPLIVAAGAVIGGAVEAAKYYQAYASGRISGQQYAELIGVGGATGAISTLSNGVVGGALLGGAGSAVNNAAEQQIVNGNINPNEVGAALGTGAIVGVIGGYATSMGSNIIKYPNLDEIYVGGSPVIDYGAAGGLIGSTLGTLLTTPSGQNTAPNWAGKEGIKG